MNTPEIHWCFIGSYLPSTLKLTSCLILAILSIYNKGRRLACPSSNLLKAQPQISPSTESSSPAASMSGSVMNSVDVGAVVLAGLMQGFPVQ